MLWWWWNQKIVVLLYNFDTTYSCFIYIQTLNMIWNIFFFLKCSCFLVAHNYWYIQTIKSSALEILLLCFHVFYLLAVIISFMVAFLYFSFFWWMEHYYLSKKKEKKNFLGCLHVLIYFFPVNWLVGGSFNVYDFNKDWEWRAS